MNRETSTTALPGPSQAPDFKKVRKYLKDSSQRERLEEYIKAGWTPAEIGEYARSVYLRPGKTYPTAASYRYAIDKGADHPYAGRDLGTPARSRLHRAAIQSAGAEYAGVTLQLERLSGYRAASTKRQQRTPEKRQ